MYDYNQALKTLLATVVLIVVNAYVSFKLQEQFEKRGL